MAFHKVTKKPEVPKNATFYLGRFLRYAVARVEPLDILSEEFPNLLSHNLFLAASEALLKRFCIESMEATFGEGIDPNALDFETQITRDIIGKLAIRVTCETYYNPANGGHICRASDARKISE